MVQILEVDAFLDSCGFQFTVMKFFTNLKENTKCDAIQEKVHEVGKQNFAREACNENEVKMIKITFLQKSLKETFSNSDGRLIAINRLF